MKAIVLIILVLTSCQLTPDYGDYWHKVYNVPPIDYEDSTIEAVARWVDFWVVYTSDKELYGKSEEWATPEQTYWARKGDCEDYVILLMYLLRRDLGLNPRMIMGRIHGIGHGWVEVNGEWWEAVGGYRIENRAQYIEVDSLNYADAMGTADEDRGLNRLVID